MKIKEKVPYSIPTPVEAALEANEAAVTTNRKKPNLRTESQESKNGGQRFNEAMADDDRDDDVSPPKLIRVPIGSLPPIQVSPIRQQQKTTLASDNQPFEVRCDGYKYIDKADPDLNSNSVMRIRYEIPENNLSRTATLILGNRKELEMHEFSSSSLKRNVDQNHIAAVVGSSNYHSQSLPEIDPSGDRQKPVD